MCVDDTAEGGPRQLLTAPTMPNEAVYHLPPYPSTSTRNSLSPAQLSTLNQAISVSLLRVALPEIRYDASASRRFMASFSRDTALQILHGLVRDKNIAHVSNDERAVRRSVLVLAEKLVSSSPGLELQTLLDFCVIYASTNRTQTQSIFITALKTNPPLLGATDSELVPAFTQLLSSAPGLHGLRKVSYCLATFLTCSPPQIIHSFAYNKPFMVAVASCYDQGLASVASSHNGGLAALRNIQSRQPEDWEIQWIRTKVALIDAFHPIMCEILQDLTSARGTSLSTKSDRVFDIMFMLLDLPSSTGTGNDSSFPIPFLDGSLIVDYNACYPLHQKLTTALSRAGEKDPRLDLLESVLESSTGSFSSRSKDPSILKILISEQPNTSLSSPFTGALPIGVDKGKGRASLPSFDPSVPDVDVKIIEVLDILPDQSPDYIRTLLEHPSFNGSPEKVLEALLEGTAPSVDDLSS